MKAKILITLKSFEKIPDISYIPAGPNQELSQFSTFTSHQKNVVLSGPMLRASRPISLIALPKKQTLFTVLRSPHIDKKSRDQFEYKIYKQLITFEIEMHQIREKLYQLKFHEIPGVQMKIVFQTRTRLCLKSKYKNNINFV